MKVIVAGSRNLPDPIGLVRKAVVASGFDVQLIISGCARGADKAGEQYADIMRLPVWRFPADWQTHGKSAGYKRNQEMAEKADALIAIWDGESKGTKHMIDIATKKGIPVYVHRP